MSETIRLVTGDAMPELNVTLRDSNTGDPADPDSWTPIDLSPATTVVRLDIYPMGSSTILETFTFTKVGGGSDGRLVLIKQATLITDAAGQYQGEIVISEDGLEDTVYDRIKFSVRA